ncbi:MAG: EamA family transporter [Nitriliruptoraceae bacterium]
MLDVPSSLLGAGLALASALMFAWANVDLRRAGDGGRGAAAVATTLWFALGLVVAPGRGGAGATGRPVPPPSALLLALAAGVGSLLLGRWAFFEAVALVGPSRASMVKNSSPVFVVLLAGLVLGDWPTPVAGAGIAVIVLGVLQYGLSRSDRRVAASDPRLALRGLAVSTAAAAIFAVGDVLLARAVRIGGDSIVLGAVVLLGGWAGAVALAPGSPLAQARALRGAGRSLISASVAMGAGRLLSFVAIGLLFVPYVAAIVATAPILTAIIGRLRGGADEVLTARLGVAMLLVVVGGAAIAIGG